MDRDEVIALVRAIGGSDRADPVCAQGDMITLDVDEVVRLVNIAAAQQAEQATQLNQSLGLYEQASEPVAWMVYTEDGKSVYVTDNPEDIGEMERALPLFAHPARPVVRLTNDDYLEIRVVTYDVVGMGDPWWFLHYGHAVESAVLKKNGLEVE